MSYIVYMYSLKIGVQQLFYKHNPPNFKQFIGITFIENDTVVFEAINVG